ncbi:helix-turn-helix transcriptional regulator [Variovorax sp. 350MFTsu5.1]|uniref:helix-turn-helix transcriptional regulator n=1 Tax=Variovorax sp. 350MFTsu5.1 TaxID=3158365 RepID=UPI003AAC1CA9
MRKNLGLALRQMRLLRGIKQTHFAQLMGVNQATVSRWERGQLALSPAQQAMAHRLLAAACDSAQDAALKRLVESSTRKVHLVCDRTHRLLAASPSRQAEWRADASEFMGRSLIGFASKEILEAEATLEELGWHAGELSSLEVATGANTDRIVPILPGRVLWERIALSDGRAGRIVTTIA